MKLVIKTFAFQVFCVILFTLIYIAFKNDFVRDPTFTKNKTTVPELLDCFFLATTVQAGVGYSDLIPNSDTSKIILILQQFIMISANLFTLYIFTL